MKNIETEAYLSDLDFSYESNANINNESKHIGTDALVTFSIPFDAAQKIMNYAVEKKKIRLIVEPIEAQK